MADIYPYTKKRGAYGNAYQFETTEIEMCRVEDYEVDKPHFERDQFITKNPNYIEFDNICELSEHSVNTERIKTKDLGMYHKEGGWPSTIDVSQTTEVNKYRRKVERVDGFAQNVKDVCDTVSVCIKQNNQIDLFEEYFYGEKSEHQVESLSSKTQMLFKDDEHKRSVSEISWYPDNPSKLAVSYAINRFQKMPENMPTKAHVWDFSQPNVPVAEINAISPVTNLMYNPKNSEIIGYGCYNGLVGIWDSRIKNTDPIVKTSMTCNSHFDPVTHFHWIASRTHTEFATTSTDGSVLYWDWRYFDNGPVEPPLYINESGDQDKTKAIGGTVLEYNTEAGPNKLLIGTEQGSIITANKRPKKNVEFITKYGIDHNRHLGPIYAINRSPTAKYFMSVGDWSCKIWVEELKTPIIRTRYHGAYLSDGCWSPTRNGAFFLTRRDGWMDVWDYYYRQNEIAYSHKVSEHPLTCIKINTHIAGAHNSGRLVAIGDQEGTVTVLQLCDSLYIPQVKEKEIVNEMFEREYRKEKQLLDLKKQAAFEGQKKPKVESTISKEEKEKKIIDDKIAEAEAIFDAMFKNYQQTLEKEEMQELDSPTSQKNGKSNGDAYGQKEESKHSYEQNENQSQSKSQREVSQKSQKEQYEDVNQDIENQYRDVQPRESWVQEIVEQNRRNNVPTAPENRKLKDLFIQDPEDNIGIAIHEESDYNNVQGIIHDICAKKFGKNKGNFSSDGLEYMDLDNFEKIQDKINYIRITVHRNLKGINLLPVASTYDLQSVEDKLDILVKQYNATKVSYNEQNEQTKNLSWSNSAVYKQNFPDNRCFYLLKAHHDQKDTEIVIQQNQTEHIKLVAHCTQLKSFQTIIQTINAFFEEIGPFQTTEEFGIVGSSLQNCGNALNVEIQVQSGKSEQDISAAVEYDQQFYKDGDNVTIRCSDMSQFEKEQDLLKSMQSTIYKIVEE